MNLKMWQQYDLRDEKESESQAKAVREIFLEFCSNSTIHGVRYFAERKRHWTEKCWWIVAFGLSVFLCAFSIYHILEKWKENPVQMTFTEKASPISTIPFPSVTICPETKANTTKFDLTHAYNSMRGPKGGPGGEPGGGPEGRPRPDSLLSGPNRERMEVLSHICQFQFPLFIHWGRNFTNESIYEIMTDLAPSLNKSMIQCMWLNEIQSCSTLFTPVLTESGLCFTFNALNSNKMFSKEMVPELMTVKDKPITPWSLERGYRNGSNIASYPKRVFSAKQTSALVVFLRVFDQDLEYVCQTLVPGFKIYLSTPGEIPAMSRKAFRVPDFEEAELTIKPTVIKTANSLRSYRPTLRQCFFDGERFLRFFKIYAQTNCEAECLTNFTRMECGCVQFSMPRDNETRICGAGKIRCYQWAEKRLFGEDVMDGVQDDVVKSFREQCNCLPACSSISYDAEMDRAKLDWAAVFKTYNQDYFRQPGTRPSMVRIYFRAYQVETQMRSEVNTIANFLACCGGLLGLFLGVSLLSIIEFLYYSTLRLYWALRRWKADHSVLPFKRRTVNCISDDVPDV